MLYKLESKFGWIERYLNDFLNWFYSLDVIFQYILLAVGIYIFVLGTIEFIRKVLFFVPRRILGIFMIIVIIYIVFGFFKS